jgi:hypothetical protein
VLRELLNNERPAYLHHRILQAVLLALPWAYGFLDARTFSPVEGITAMNLVSGCQLQYYTPPVQSENTLMLTGPSMDMMRLLPLPVEQPWMKGVDKKSSIDSEGWL